MGQVIQDSAAVDIGTKAAAGGNQRVGLIRVDDVTGPWSVNLWLDFVRNPATGPEAIVTAPGAVVPDVWVSYRVGRSRALVNWQTQRTAPIRNHWRSTFHADSLDISIIIPDQTPGTIVPCIAQAWVCHGPMTETREPGAVPFVLPANFAASVAAGVDYSIPYGAEWLEIAPPAGVLSGGAPVAVGTFQVLFWDITGTVLAGYLVQPQVVGVFGAFEGVRSFPVPSQARFCSLESIAPAVADGVLVPVSWRVCR